MEGPYGILGTIGELIRVPLPKTNVPELGDCFTIRNLGILA